MLQLIEQCADTPLKFDILLFWGRYPAAEFTLGAIARALNSSRRFDVEHALEALADLGLINKQIKQGVNFYRLTADPQWRQPILELSAYNRHELKQMKAHPCLFR